MPHPIAAGQKHVARVQLVNHVHGDRRVALGTQAAHQNIGMRVGVGFGFGDLAAIHQRLHVGVVAGAVHHAAILEVVDARIARMRPVAVAPGIDEKRRNGAVRLLLGRDGRQADDDVGLMHHVLEHGRRVVAIG